MAVAATSLEDFQQVLDRVAASGHREEVDQERLPDVNRWGGIDSRGCRILVEGGKWWVVPPFLREVAGDAG